MADVLTHTPPHEPHVTEDGKFQRGNGWLHLPDTVTLGFFIGVGKRTLNRIGGDNLPILAAGVAFYAFLSIFPAIAGSLMVWGMFAEPPDVRQAFEVLRGIIPPDAFNLIADELVRISAGDGAGLTLGALIALVLAVWSASAATSALLSVIDQAYDRNNRRGFLESNFAAIRFTVMGIAFVIVSIAAIGAVPPILAALRLGAVMDALIGTLRWLLLVAVFYVAAASTYRATPSHKRRRREGKPGRPIHPGAMAAATIWLVACVGFSFYLSAFADYNKTFGSLGAVAALLMWFWISAYAIGIGAEINAEWDAKLAGKPPPPPPPPKVVQDAPPPA